jgi:hypothetical protein
MHGLSIRPFTCNWVFTKTQYAAETPRAKVGWSICLPRCVSTSANPFLDNSRVTDNSLGILKREAHPRSSLTTMV